MDDIKLPSAARSQTMPNSNLNSQPFAGRIGGNQLFALRQSECIGDEPADARQDATWKQILDLRGFRDVGLWKNAFIEGFGLCLQVFIAGIIAAGVIPLVTATSVGPIIPVGIAAIIQFIIITLFILAAGPVTGGRLMFSHDNKLAVGEPVAKMTYCSHFRTRGR
jgi:hypothetical protein